MEENVQQLLKDKDENVVQFNFENNTSSPIAITLFDTASLTTIPTSGTQQTTYTASNDLAPNLPPSFLELNPTNGLILAGEVNNPYYRIVNSINNNTLNDFDNTNGFNFTVRVISIQSDGKILVGGNFTTYKGLTENSIIRLNTDGTKDLSFNNSIGFNVQVSSISIQSDGKILVGGSFTTYKGLIENRIIRLNSDGTKDLTFDNSIGFNIAPTIISIQSDGKILCMGAFTSYKGLTENRIIRLNTDGTKDLTFDNSIGFNNTVLDINIQSDGKILVGGNFTTYKGLTENRIIRLNTDGTKDLTFDNSIGFNGFVDNISIQSNGEILVGGAFTTYKGFVNERIVKLNSDGNILSVLELGSATYTLSFCPTNNSFYTCPYQTFLNNDIYVISGNGQNILNQIPLPLATQQANSVQYNSVNNCMYYLLQDITLSQGKIIVLDCNTNTITATINLPSFNNSFVLSNPNSANEIYFFDNSTSFIQKIDCNTNTLVLINLSLPNISSSASSFNFNSVNNKLYCTSSINNFVDIVDTLTDTYFSSITIPISNSFLSNLSAINTLTNELFITDINILTDKKIAVIDCNTNTLNSVQILSSTIGLTQGILYNSLTNSMYISGSLFSVVTFTASPFFIGGSTNYNTFVNSLNFEPIFVDEIR